MFSPPPARLRARPQGIFGLSLLLWAADKGPGGSRTAPGAGHGGRAGPAGPWRVELPRDSILAAAWLTPLLRHLWAGTLLRSDRSCVSRLRMKPFPLWGTATSPGAQPGKQKELGSRTHNSFCSRRLLFSLPPSPHGRSCSRQAVEEMMAL